MDKYEEVLSKLDEAVQNLVAYYNEQEGGERMMLNKWYLAGQCMMVSDQSVTWNFGEPSKNCPLSDQLGMIVFNDTLIRARIADDDD